MLTDVSPCSSCLVSACGTQRIYFFGKMQCSAKTGKKNGFALSRNFVGTALQPKLTCVKYVGDSRSDNHS